MAGPDQAFIVTGRKGKPVKNVETGEISTDLSGQKVVMGGGVFVAPRPSPQLRPTPRSRG